MEIEWVRNVPVSQGRMEEIRSVAEGLGLALTVHAPYYVNLNSPEKATLAASKTRVLRALEMAETAGAVSVCVHAAFNLKMEPEKVYGNVTKAVGEIMEKKAQLFPHVNLALETMGKHAQFGTLEEVLRISKEYGIYPCVDFAHIHARYQGKFNTAAEWDALLDHYQEALGKEALREMHIHYSGINYGPSGERNHLRLEQSDANWKDFLRVLKKRKVGGILVCESPESEKDTLLMQKVYQSLP